MVISNYSVSSSPEYFQNCSYVAKGAPTGLIANFSTIVVKDFKTAIFKVLVEASSSGNSYTKVLDYKIDLCDVMKGTQTNRLIKALVADLQRSGKNSFKCPFKKV